METQMQGDLFPSPDDPVNTTATLFAEVVFDRPLDHSFTYSVGEEHRLAIAVGKRVRVPFGRGDKKTTGYVIRLTEEHPMRPVKEVLSVLDQEVLIDDSLLRLTRWMADYYLCGWGQILNGVVPAGARDKAGTRTGTFILAVDEKDCPDPPVVLSDKQQAVLKVLRECSEPIDLKGLTRLARCGSGPIESLIKKGYARRVSRRLEKEDAPSYLEQVEESNPQLNPDQVKAWTRIKPVLEGSGFHAFLLHGVTGSGKTEIYLRAIEEVLRQGKQIIVLVPEISLTPQTIQRFRGRFHQVAVLHSHLGDAERGRHWRRVASGSISVVVGARSAVFAPTRNLGLIIIDEEHESSFKQESTPRYHARDVAVMRARLQNIPIILGSATPSLESYHNCQRGTYDRIPLPKRVLDLPMPPVVLIDRRHDRPRNGILPALSDRLEYAIREALRTGGQVILLLNRRGFSTHIHCPACGHVESCRFCDLALTFHKHREVMLCHHCGFEQEPVQRCTQCGQSAMRYQGLGTEKLQQEIESRFPDKVVRRMDSDTMRKPGSHEQILTAFQNGLIHILLGTQMIAKGLDFPNVTLVGVINADVGLHVPDFRSAERTFQLLSQVSGRAGRGPRGGKVLVQTLTPDHPGILFAANHDYEGFVTAELAQRREHAYPPYSRLARIIVRSRDQNAAEAFANILSDAFHDVLNQHGPTQLRLLGPAEAPVFRLKGYFRFHFQLQSPSSGILHQALRQVIPLVKPAPGVEFTLDIDPLQML